ncbi:hypothetical protein N9X46_00085 [Paracoccaceae bacterium]|nr:hypothetical protein [Paracoccaceae bacterium]
MTFATPLHKVDIMVNHDQNPLSCSVWTIPSAMAAINKDMRETASREEN